MFTYLKENNLGKLKRIQGTIFDRGKDRREVGTWGGHYKGETSVEEIHVYKFFKALERRN